MKKQGVAIVLAGWLQEAVGLWVGPALRFV